MIYLFLAGIAFVVFNKKDKIEETIDEHLDSWTLYDDLFKKYGQLNSIAWQYLKAICLNESNLGKEKSVARGLLNPSDVENSKSSDGKSWGLMQVTIPTGKEFDPTCSPEKLNNAEYSIKLGAKILKNKQSYFLASDPRQLEWTVKSYNQGQGNSKKEKAGQIEGYAEEYWQRFKRNLERVNNS
jgi:hypothetical protein